MGFFGNFWEKAKNAAKKVGNAVKAGAKKVIEGGKNLWNNFTGKTTFDEAEALYEKISERYDKRRLKFETDVDTYSRDIENHVTSINRYKEKIKKELFPQMAEKMKKLCDVEVSEKFNFEEFEIGNYSFDELRAKEQLYKIDFNKHPFKSNALAILTLGFASRKKAKETLFAVQEEEKKIDTEIAKMNAETIRLEAIKTSLANVDHYFEQLVGIYEQLLIRLDTSINFLFVRCMSFAHKIIRQEMSIRHLPKMQIEEIKAIVSASQILKEMTEKQIVSLEDKEAVSKYEDSMKSDHSKIITQYTAA